MKTLRHILFYKPYWPYVLVDIILLALSFFVVLMWFPLSTQFPFQKYDTFAVLFSCIWILVNYMTHRYGTVKFMHIGTNALRLLTAMILVFGVMELYMYLMAGEMNYSVWLLLTIWITVSCFSFVFLLISHAYRYALNEESEIERDLERGPQSVLRPPIETIDEQQRKNIRDSILAYGSPHLFDWLERHTDLFSSNTYTLRTAELYNLQKLKYYRFDTIINLMPLNQIRGINKMFGVVNDHLPDNGRLVCCFEPQSTIKRKILSKYPPILNWVIYTLQFLYKRVMPKILMTSRLYYDITEGKNRILSKAEVLGRLYYCGFQVIGVHKVDNLIYVIAMRDFRPQTIRRRMYGIFVKLNRIGKNGRMFNVYKFRTMHPYSEYLQAYIYEHYGLQAGGKFEHDIRVTTIGRFMRKYWIDELPMLINLLKGNMKLVGVRPISKHYFSLYSKQLQEQRLRHKPGLLPPFYADMPKTLEEIEASERKYLTRCEKQGTLWTDFVYFWKIFYTIIFKHAHSH